MIRPSFHLCMLLLILLSTQRNIHKVRHVCIHHRSFKGNIRQAHTSNNTEQTAAINVSSRSYGCDDSVRTTPNGCCRAFATSLLKTLNNPKKWEHIIAYRHTSRFILNCWCLLLLLLLLYFKTGRFSISGAHPSSSSLSPRTQIYHEYYNVWCLFNHMRVYSYTQRPIIYNYYYGINECVYVEGSANCRSWLELGARNRTFLFYQQQHRIYL